LSLIDDEIPDSPYVTPRLRRRVHAVSRGSPLLATILPRPVCVRAIAQAHTAARRIERAWDVIEGKPYDLSTLAKSETRERA
jgi:hypothetical protein